MSLTSRWWRPTMVTALVLVGCQATPAPLQSGQAAAPTVADGYQLLDAGTSECGPLADLITTRDLTRTVYYPNCTTTITPADVATGVLADCGLALRPRPAASPCGLALRPRPAASPCGSSTLRRKAGSRA